MKIGVFDSGLGGLAVARAIMARLPEYEYVYLGDTKRVPYGGRSQEAIHEFTSEALDFLFAADCHLVVLACNTASAEALRKTQQEYLPDRYPDRRVLGVVIPCVEAAVATGAHRIGVLGTRSTVESGAYPREIIRRCPEAEVVQVAAPMLVPLIENDAVRHLDPFLQEYLDALGYVEALVLGCTHYSLIASQVRRRFAGPVLVSDEVVPEKLADYLLRHPEHESKLGRTGSRRYCLTDLTSGYAEMAARLMGDEIDLERVQL